MKSSIFIPKTINVGFQNRSDTYTKKLAYIIYYDEKGKLRKETSWNSWRDDKIPNEEFDNTPTSGFVLNKKVGDYNSGWNHRMAYCRIYDPRNFEFEITIENLLYILENTNSIKGKGLEGDFVYGWDGKDLVLIPCDSPDYKQMQEYNDIVHNNLEIKNKDLKIGATYIDKGKTEYVYVGRFDYYDSDYVYSRGERHEMRYDDDRKYETHNINKGKYYFFAQKSNWRDEDYSFSQFKSISKKFIDCVDENCHKDYSKIFDILEHRTSYSPLDKSKYECIPMTLDGFFKSLSRLNSWNYEYCMSDKKVKHKISSAYDTVEKKYLDGLYVCHSGVIVKDDWRRNNFEYTKIPDGFKTKTIKVTDGWRHTLVDKTVEFPATLEEIYNIIKPIYRNRYLENGKFYDKETSWDE